MNEHQFAKFWRPLLREILQKYRYQNLRKLFSAQAFDFIVDNIILNSFLGARKKIAVGFYFLRQTRSVSSLRKL